jgi:hypothetical protein
VSDKLELQLDLDPLKVRILPIGLLRKGVQLFSKIIRRKSTSLIEQTAESIKDTMLESFKLPKTGKFYMLPGGRIYRASAPEEPPAIKTGMLSDSISITSTIEGAEILIDAPYARRLELGGGSILPRPYVKPAIMQEEKNRKGILFATKNGSTDR